MADSPENLAAPSANPIFADLDIPCPHCDYNLRGLIEPRCPECGEAFDAQELLKPPRRPAGPGLLWALPRMIAHPVTFWSRLPIRGSAGPGWIALYGLLLLGTLLATVAAEVPRTVWEQKARIQPVLQGFHRYVQADSMAESIVVLLPLSLGALMLCLLHKMVCGFVLRRAGVKDPENAAKAIVGYSAIWMLVAGPAGSGCLFWIEHRVPVFNVGSWVQVVGATAAAALAIASVCWARSLLEGGRSIAAASVVRHAVCT